MTKDQSSMINGFEKHAQTAIQVILVGIVVWSGSQIISLRDSSIRNEEKAMQLRETIVELKSDLGSIRILIASSAEKTMDMNQRLKDIEYRLSVLERQSRRSNPQ